MPSHGGKPRASEQARLEEILQHFKNEFPLDPITPFGAFFAKRSCAQCNGRGILAYLQPSEPTIADLRLCACASKRRDRFVLKALLFEAARDRGGVAFAEGTVCSTSGLQLPTNPARQAGELSRAASDSRSESTSP